MAMRATKKWTVFASHSKKRDYTPHLVRLVQHHLESKGHTVFFDLDSLHHISKKELQDAVATSHTFFLFLDDLTLESQWCQEEIMFAVMNKLPIFVVVDEDQHRISELIKYWRDDMRVGVARYLFGANSNQAIAFSWNHVELQNSALQKVEAAIAKVLGNHRGPDFAGGPEPCITPGCGKPSWNGMRGEKCSSDCGQAREPDPVNQAFRGPIGQWLGEVARLDMGNILDGAAHELGNVLDGAVLGGSVQATRAQELSDRPGFFGTYLLQKKAITLYNSTPSTITVQVTKDIFTDCLEADLKPGQEVGFARGGPKVVTVVGKFADTLVPGTKYTIEPNGFRPDIAS